MAFKVDVVQLGTSDTQIASMPANAEGSVHGLVICNNQTSARTFTLRLYDASEGTTSLIVLGVTVAAGAQFTWTKPINLQPNDVLYGSGADIVVLASIYEGVAVPAAVGFTGRGAWSSIATYAPNDVVSYNNNSYLANVANTNSLPTGTDWTLLAAQGAAGTLPNLIRTPTAIYPLTGGDTVPPNGPLTASAYAPLYSADTRNYRTFQVATNADTTFSSPVFAINVNADSTIISPNLTITTAYRWRCKDVSTTGAESDWMTVQTFTTKNLSVSTPTITVEGGPVTVGRSPLLTGSAYTTTPDASATHLSTNWEVRKTSDSSLVWSSYNNTVNLTTIQVPYDVLAVSTSYAFRAQYNSTLYGSSAYGSTTASTTSTFPNTTYTPATISTEKLYLTTSQKAVASISDDAFVMAYSEIPSANNPATLNATLKLSIWNRTAGVFVESASSIINAATDMAMQTGCFDVEMLTSTLGVVTWKTYFEGTGNGYIYSRGFNVSGNTITFGTATLMDSVTTTSRQRFPKITRLNDDLAILTYWGGNESLQPFGRGIKFVNTTMTVSAATVLTIATLTGESPPIPIEIKRVSNTGFVCATWYSDGAFTTYNQRFNGGTVNATTAAVTLGSNVTFATGTLSGSTPKIAVLTSTLAVFGCANTYNQLTISGVTVAFGTGGQITASTDNWNQVNYDLIRATDTTAFAFFQTAGRVITATTTTSQGVSQSLQPQTSTNATVVRISDSAGVTRYEQWSQNSQNTFNTMISLLTGSLTSPAVSVLQVEPFSTEYTDLIRNSSTIALSTSRAVVMTREAGYASSSTLGRPVLAIWNISPNTPTLLARTLTNIVGDSSTGQSTLCALTTSRILMTVGNRIYLFSVADSGFTQLATTTLASFSSNATLTTSIVRISDTQAIVCYRNASNGINFVPTNLTGDTISLGTTVVTSVTTSSISIIATALSATRVLVAFSESSSSFYKASLIGFNGTNWVSIQSDFTLTPASLTAGPASLVTLDSNRAIFAYQTSSVTIGQVATINATGDVLAISGFRTTATLTSASQAIYAVALDSTNGIVGIQESTGTALYSFTVGAGTAQPSVLTKVADLNTNTVQGAPALRLLPVTAIAMGITPTAQVLTQERNGGTNQNSEVFLRKFLKGSP